MAEVVITLVHGRHEHLLRQWRMLRTVAPEVSYVVIAMGDNAIAGLLRLDPHAHVVEIPVTPDGLPLAAARNLGVRTARQLGGEPELLVILDVDCLPGPGLITRYAEAGRRAPDDLLCGPVTYLPQGLLPETPEALAAATAPHPARPAPEAGDLERDGVHDLFWSLSFALTPATWDRIGGFCEEFTGYGGEDTDFAWRAKAAGVGLAWVGGADAYHQWHPVSTPADRASRRHRAQCPDRPSPVGSLADARVAGCLRGVGPDHLADGRERHTTSHAGDVGAR